MLFKYHDLINIHILYIDLLNKIITTMKQMLLLSLTSITEWHYVNAAVALHNNSDM